MKFTILDGPPAALIPPMNYSSQGTFYNTSRPYKKKTEINE